MTTAKDNELPGVIVGNNIDLIRDYIMRNSKVDAITAHCFAYKALTPLDERYLDDFEYVNGESLPSRSNGRCELERK